LIEIHNSSKDSSDLMLFIITLHAKPEYPWHWWMLPLYRHC